MLPADGHVCHARATALSRSMPGGRKCPRRSALGLSAARDLGLSVACAETPAWRWTIGVAVPAVSEFFGIAIYLYHHDHPPAHFHARYGGQWASIAIADLAILASDLPPRALGLVLEWAQLHRAELAANWERAANRRPLEPVAPLR